MADPAATRAHALALAGVGTKRAAEEQRPDKYKDLHRVLERTCAEVEEANGRLSRRVYKMKKVLEHVKRERSILMEKLDQYEDGYREAAKSIQESAITSITSIAGSHTGATADAENVIGFPSVRGGPGRQSVGESGAPASPSAMNGPGRKGGKGSLDELRTPMHGMGTTPGGGGGGGGKKGSKHSPGSGAAGSPQVTSSGKSGAGGSQSKPKPDPNAPKKPSNAFFMYSQIQRTAIQEEYHASAVTGHHELTKLIAKKWNELPTDEKKVYYDMYEKDKERYATELRSYQLTGSVPSSSSTTPHEGNTTGKGAASSSSKSAKKSLSSALASGTPLKMSMTSSSGDGGSPLLSSIASSVASSITSPPPLAPSIREPPLELGSSSPPPAMPLFDDDNIGVGLGSTAAALVDSSSPLMEYTPPDVLVSAGAPSEMSFDEPTCTPPPPLPLPRHIKLHKGMGVVAGGGDDDDHHDVDPTSDAEASDVGLAGSLDDTLGAAPRHHHPVSAGSGGLSLVDDDDDDDLRGVYTLDDGGSSAGLDPQEAASIARSFEDDSEEDPGDLQLGFHPTMMDN
ncbi:transcription factor SOX-4-like [Sycon ciliatum]|uniref:transcription factor SOX-4-like n=1 Tax=Sycon ciliatum TaxID=27933 RepID=UPI0031F61266